MRGFARTAGAALLAAASATALAPAGAAQARAGSPHAIPEGAAVWFACTEPSFTGPLSLRCPLGYDPRYVSTFLRGFERMTPENEFKMEYLEPQEDRFAFAVADQIAAFARAHGKTIRGHTLIWSRQNPWWLDHPLLPWSREALARVMDTYISTVVSHFAALFPHVVTEWDVVNEPLLSDGQLGSNPWEAVLGRDYIRLALEDARAADPTARLLINDNQDGLPGPEPEAMLALATQLKQSGAPLDAVGFEAHVTPTTVPTLHELVSLWRRYARAGLDVEVTELDVANGSAPDAPAVKAAIFERYARACRMAGNCIGFTTWGVADTYSWLGPVAGALLYDASFHPSPAVPVVRRLLGLTQAAARPSRYHPRRGLRRRAPARNSA